MVHVSSDPPEVVWDEGISAFGQLLEATTRLERRLGRRLEEDCELPHPWFEVLLRLARSPEGRIAIGELGRQVLLTSGGMTRLVDRMAEAGLVVREPSPTDRRIQWVRATPEGMSRLAAAAAVHAANIDELVTRRLTARELQTLLRVLEKISGS
jgi:MarR family 2-MHQ and catechol resistance regulon transcriptional repressor